MWAPGASGSASPRPAPGRAGARGKGSAKFRQRRASSLSGRLRESRRLGRAPLPPSGVTPPRCPLGGGRSGGRALSACGCLPEAPRGARAGERGPGAGDVLLLLPGVGSCCVSAASGSVAVCACRGEYQGSVVGSTSSPLSHQVRSVDVYYVTCD